MVIAIASITTMDMMLTVKLIWNTCEELTFDLQWPLLQYKTDPSSRFHSLYITHINYRFILFIYNQAS